jgi:hypothetical protein
MSQILTSFQHFDPSRIDWQDEATDYIMNADYSKGAWEFLFSGAVGSAKTTLGAHLAVRHCFDNPGAVCMIGRRARPDLRKTLFAEIIDHLDDGHLKDGVHYEYSEQQCMVWFPPWKSMMIPGYWADRRWKRFRSMKLSMALIEELTEANNEEEGLITEIVARLNRIPGINTNLLVAMTNPDSPLLWPYKRWISDPSPLRKIFYSKTKDNPFLAPSYYEKLKNEYDPKMALRMLEGEWIEISQEKIYYAYDHDRNFINSQYSFDASYPIDIMHDFNIGFGKPISAAIGQHIDGKFHVGASVLIDGARTGAIMDEIANRGFFELGNGHVRVFGDSSGKHNDTRNVKSDYDIIEKFLANYRRKNGLPISYERRVPLANPAIRSRHNMLNGVFLNANHQATLWVYRDAKDADTGFRLTNFKKGAQLVEDDTLREQHVTTAIGYWVHHVKTKVAAAPIEFD